MGKSVLPKVIIGIAVVVAIALFARYALIPSGPPIQTVFASYGYAAERKDVKDDIVKLCDGKTSCDFAVKNETFTLSKGAADPSPDNDKGLMIAWKCGATNHKEQFAEGRTAKVDCGPDSVVPPAAPK